MKMKSHQMFITNKLIQTTKIIKKLCKKIRSTWISHNFLVLAPICKLFTSLESWSKTLEPKLGHKIKIVCPRGRLSQKCSEGLQKCNLLRHRKYRINLLYFSNVNLIIPPPLRGNGPHCSNLLQQVRKLCFNLLLG